LVGRIKNFWSNECSLELRRRIGGFGSRDAPNSLAIVFKGGFMRINKIGGLLLAGVLALGAPLSSQAQNSGAKQDIKEAGQSLKQATKKTGKAVKKVTKKVTNKVAKKTRQGAEKVEDKTK
jgi:hypothetical protein